MFCKCFDYIFDCLLCDDDNEENSEEEYVNEEMEHLLSQPYD